MTPSSSGAPLTDLIPTLITETPAEGRELAIMMARKTIATLQPDESSFQAPTRRGSTENAHTLREGHIVAVEFATIAPANNYWRHAK